MKKIFLLLLIAITFSSCGSSKKRRTAPKTQTVKIDSRSKRAEKNPKADKVVNYALKFDGVKYKYGGTTKKGMDCSGLVFTSFNSEHIALPRSTSGLSSYGDWIDLKKVIKGDLLFFATNKNSRHVNHVGIVTEARNGNVEFIHASTSNGVMVSNLAEKYWYFAFVQARRVL